MTVIDRYVFWLFSKVFLVCFASIAGLFVIIHLFTNFDELLRIPDRSSELPALLAAFYGPRLLDFFDRSSSYLTLIAASFALAMMQRRRELIAIESAGICRQRMMRPIFFAAIFVGALAVWNREHWIPQNRDFLVRTVQTWRDDQQKLSYFQKDHYTGLHIKGNTLDMNSQSVENPTVQIPLHVSRSVNRLSARSGTFQTATDQHPAGLRLHGLDDSVQTADSGDLTDGQQTIVFFSGHNPWLQADECFVVTRLTAEDLAFGERLSQFASLQELIQGSNRPTQWYSRSARIAIHNRLVRPVFDLVVLILALPLVLSQAENQLWRAVALAIVTIVGCQGLVYLATTLGTLGWIPSAAFAAWFPLFVMLPLTPWTLRLMRT
ncbi:MAG TPA: LptF/LptG family permease [Pirellulaceae bacterium]|nr:LptF/LptG family permease [Pirellulaceae bacterium]